MKKMMSKNLTQKIVITIIIVLSFNFTVPNFSQAGLIANFGGKLMEPVIDFIAGLFDLPMMLLQSILDGSKMNTLGYGRLQ